MTPKEKEKALAWQKSLLAMISKSFPDSTNLAKAVELGDQKVFYEGPVNNEIVDLHFQKQGDKDFCCILCDKSFTKVGGGDKWALMELSFTHVTSKTWANSLKFGFFRIFFRLKKCPPLVKSHFENTMGNPFFYFFKY